MAYLIGLDPGFASFGYGVLQADQLRTTIECVGVFHTKKAIKKQSVLAAEDNFVRARELAQFLRNLLLGLSAQKQPIVLVAESMSFPRSSSSAAKVAMSWGILAALSEEWQLPLVQASPQQIKYVLCEDRKASKEAVQGVLMRRYSGQFDAFVKNTPSGQWEHGFDAVGAVVACLGSDVIRIARGMT